MKSKRLVHFGFPNNSDFYKRKNMEVIKMTENKPIKKFSSGLIQASIWSNTKKDDDGKEETYNSVTFKKQYSTDGKIFKPTDSFLQSELPRAIAVLKKAYDYLSVKEE